jgi:hypothetical protein
MGIAQIQTVGIHVPGTPMEYVLFPTYATFSAQWRVLARGGNLLPRRVAAPHRAFTA